MPSDPKSLSSSLSPAVEPAPETASQRYVSRLISIPADIPASTDRYALRFAGRIGQWMLDVQTRSILGFLSDLPDATVLDVGGGHAQVSPPVVAAGHDVTTLVSTSSAGERLARVSMGKASITVGSVETMPFEDNSFDVVVSVRMLAHVDDWPAFVAELCRVARKAVIVDFPNARGFNAATPMFFGAKKRLEGDTRPYACMGLDEVKAVFDRAGFSVDMHTGQFVLPMALHRMIGRSGTTGVSKALEKLLGPLSSVYGNPVLLRAVRVPLQ